MRCENLLVFVRMFCFFFAVFLHAQEKRIDSLENILIKNITKEKEIKVKLLLIEYYNEINTKKATEYLNNLINQENNITNQESFINYSILRVLYYKKKGEFDKSKKWAALALQKSGKLKDSIHLKFRINYLLGGIADDESDIELAIRYHLKALEYAERSGDYKNQSIVLGGIARAYMFLSEYKKAKEYLLKAIAIKMNHKEFDVHLANCYENLSSCFDEERNYKKSLEYIDKAIKLYKDNNSVVDLISIYNNKAYTLLLMNRLKAAENTIKRSLFLADSTHSSDNEKMFSYSTYAEILFAQKKTDKAFKYINKSIELSEKYNDLYLEKYNLNLVYQIYLRQKNYKKALFYYQKRNAVLDTIHNLRKRKEIENLMLNYETEKKNKTILLLEKEKQLNAVKLNTNKWIQIVFLLLIILLFVLIILLKNRYKNKEKTTLLKKQSMEANFEKMLKEEELQTLRSQMNPHFLFNCLNSINSFIIKNDKEKASEYLLNFSALIRNVLHNSKQSKILLSKELETLELYVKMELLRFPHQFKFKVIVEDDVEKDFIEIPPLIIQPFVENSIRHGFIGKNDGKIKVHIKQEKNYLLITIEDNGIGREASKKNNKRKNLQKKSYGIKITEERLNLMQVSEKSFKPLEIIDLKDAKNKPLGTKVSIKIKL